ncbi:23S rRNA (adenine(2030)-N(6))-methyltransferase RlmJ, partial [Rhizobium ruizarguesonis]
RVLDTHAGIGLYDLSSEEAQKTGECLDGIVKLMEAELGPHVSELLEPYLSAIRELNPEGGIACAQVSASRDRSGCRP